jgi:dGTPase
VDHDDPGLQPLLEAQVVDASDSVAYDAHDTDDAVKLGLVSLDQLAEIPLIAETLGRVRNRFTGISAAMTRKTLVHELIDFQVGDVLRHSFHQLSCSGLRHAREARQRERLIGPSPALLAKKVELEKFLHENVYRHPFLLDVRVRAQTRMREVFDCYQRDPARMSPRFQHRISAVGVARAAGEYLAGMTDRYFEQQYERVHAK